MCIKVCVTLYDTVQVYFDCHLAQAKLAKIELNILMVICARGYRQSSSSVTVTCTIVSLVLFNLILATSTCCCQSILPTGFAK